MAYPNPSFHATAPPPDEQSKPSPSLYSPPQGPPPTSLTYQQQPPQPTSTASLSSMPPQPVNAPYTTHDPHQQEQPSHTASEPEKIVVAVVTGILVLVVIGVTYATALSTRILDSSKVVLAASITLTFFNLVLAIWLCMLIGRKSRTGALALIPVTLSITAGCLSILYFASVVAVQSGDPLPDINLSAVIVSSAFFAGLGGGAMISYVASAQN